MSDHVVVPWLVAAVAAIAYVTAFSRSGAARDHRLTVAVGAVALLLGAWQLEGLLLPRWRAHHARDWASAAGVVVRSQVQTTTPGRRSRWRENYYAYVNAEFVAESGMDTTVRVGLTRDPARREAAQAVVDRYPVGAGVRVHFDPAEPWAGVLEREAPPAAPLGLMVAGALAVAGVVLLGAPLVRTHRSLPHRT